MAIPTQTAGFTRKAPDIRRSTWYSLLPRDWKALSFCALIWAAQSYVLFSLLLERSVNLPYYDEWDAVPVLTGHQPITLSWLWSQNNEHRILLPRLVYLAAFFAGGRDFRTIIFVNAFILCAFALAACWTARRLRGRSSYADAVFPCALLHLGQAENLVWGFQIAFILGFALSLCALFVLLQKGPLSARASIGLGVCTALFPLVGGHGLAFVPAFSLVVFGAAASLRRRGEPRRHWLPVAGLGLTALVLLGVYFIGYVHPSKHPITSDLQLIFIETTQFITTGLGTAVTAYWPWLGNWYAWLLLTTLLALLHAMVTNPLERSRAIRLAIFGGGMVCLSLGIAWARAGLYQGVGGLFVSRYVTLASPLICVAYFSWELLRPRWIADAMQFALFLTAAALVLPNRIEGLRFVNEMQPPKAQFLADVRAGQGAAALALGHCSSIYPTCPAVFSEWIEMLRDAELEDYRQIAR